jgi:hypothetical protein
MVLLAAAVAGSARAATYSGVWDPAFGAPFTGLGWRGTATFFVPDTCDPSGTAVISNSPLCGGNAIVTSAQVELYNDAAAGDPTVATLTFNPASMIIDTMSFVSGQLDQLTTSYSNFVNPPENLSAFGVGSSVEFALFFDISALSGPHLLWRNCVESSFEPICTSGINDAAQFPPEFTITSVPEPGTLALVCIGLLGLGTRRGRAMLRLTR